VELLSLAEASVMLGISPERVRQLVVAGWLPGVRIGNAWAVPRDAVTARRHIPGRPGRPLGARRAWERLLVGPVALAERGRVVNRAAVHRYEMSRADLDALSTRHPVMVSGVTGAIEHGEPLHQPGSGGDLYLPISLHRRLPDLVALVTNPLGPIVLRVVPDEPWLLLCNTFPRLREGRPVVAPRSVVALDLCDSGDPRLWIAAQNLVDDTALVDGTAFVDDALRGDNAR
jgi:excisionase family DNA binding protein